VTNSNALTDYDEFLASKARLAPYSGIELSADDITRDLFPFQKHVTALAVRRGRAAIWADTGLGKTRMQGTWCDEVLKAEPDARALIEAPLGVAQQTIDELSLIGIEAEYVRNDAEVQASQARIVISNYERLDAIDPRRFAAVSLDESSILKSFSGSTKRLLVDKFADTKYRLSASATPAPNDLEELCNHAHFLGVMTPQEMRTTFFIADSRGEFMRYRLKGHAKDAFFTWLASWAVAIRHPRDLGFEQDGYDLPPLTITDHIIDSGWTPDDALFSLELAGITERAQVARDTLEMRVATAVDVVTAEPDERWLVWVNRNDEAEQVLAALRARLPKATIAEVRGSDHADDKAATLSAFARGDLQILVTKKSIAAYGLNFQSSARQVFVAVDDSYEQYYQAIRRQFRFGQTRPVHVHLVAADVQQPILDNIRTKERVAADTTAGLIAAIVAENRRELFAGTSRADSFEPQRAAEIPDWLKGNAA
jgi:hypothetical protein